MLLLNFFINKIVSCNFNTNSSVSHSYFTYLIPTKNYKRGSNFPNITKLVSSRKRVQATPQESFSQDQPKERERNPCHFYYPAEPFSIFFPLSGPDPLNVNSLAAQSSLPVFMHSALH